MRFPRAALLLPPVLLLAAACAQASPSPEVPSPTPTPTPPVVTAIDTTITTTDGGIVYLICDSPTGNLIYLSNWKGAISVAPNSCPKVLPDGPLANEREIQTPDAGLFVIVCHPSTGNLIYLSTYEGGMAVLAGGCPKD